MPPIIEVLELVKRYKGARTNAVDGVSFDVAAGEPFALLGIVFQKPSLDQNLSAEENVRFHAVLYGPYPFRPTFRAMARAYREQVAQLAALVGIERDMGKPVKTFSGGMKRKREIVRSLMHRPSVLFLDEPSVGLDPASRRNLWQYLVPARAEHGVTVFLTTHYRDEAEQSDDVRTIKGGRVVVAGTPAALKAQLLRPYLVVDAADRGRLAAELRGLGVAFEEGPRLRVELDGRGVHELLRAVQTPLTPVQTHDPTLEDASLAIVEEPAE